MKFFLTSLLLGSLVLVSPAVVSAASEASQENMEGQAMIKPPSSASEQASDTSEEQTEGTTSSSDSSAGMDWSAANTKNKKTQGSFTVCVDAGHQGSWVDMSA